MRALIAAVLLCVCAVAQAASIETLKTFLRQTTSGKARFAQIIVDKNLKELQRVTGTMQFQRPGKFRWEYNKPYEQTIVGDGAKLWVYDKDLNQVSVRKLDQALGNSPAALLAGNNDIERIYTLNNLGNQEGLDWLEAVPKSKENAFERIRLGFSAAGLEAMELRDAFGQVTIIKFADLERNPVIAPQNFQFTPPKGADIITE